LGLDAKDFYVDQLLPIDGGFIKKLNNSGQGDCGFKALAQQMYHPEDETKHNIVRSLMLETLEKKQGLLYYLLRQGCFPV